MKIALYGAAAHSGVAVLKKAAIVGAEIARNNHILITGACPGIPHEAARAAFLAGGKVIGYSPACSKNTHMIKLKDPIDCFTKIIYIPGNYQHKSNLSACYKYRNINTAIAADKVLIIGGQFGTLNEFTLAYEMGKEIGVLINTGGTADLVKIIIKKLHKKTGAKVYYHSNPNKLLKIMKIK